MKVISQSLLVYLISIVLLGCLVHAFYLKHVEIMELTQERDVLRSQLDTLCIIAFGEPCTCDNPKHDHFSTLKREAGE